MIEKVKSLLRSVSNWLWETKFRLSDLWVLGLYAGLIGFGSWHHEPWSDETLPWLIGRDSNAHDFLKILFQNWDRHPGLFHTILLPFAKLGCPFSTQSILNALFALGAAYLFLAKAPFSRALRYLFLFSFYMAYEYSVIVRPYMLSILILFFIAAFYPRRGERPLLYALLIVLLLHSDYIIFGLGAGLTLSFAFENRKLFLKNRSVLIALLIITANVLPIFHVARSLPAGHAEYGRVLPFHIQNGMMPVANAFFPFSTLNAHPEIISAVATALGFAVLLLTFFSLAGKPAPLWTLGSSLIYLCVVFLFWHAGDYRHHGFILLSVLFALWIAESYPDSEQGFFKNHCRKARGFALGLIAAGLLFGLQNVYFVFVQEYHLPFSGAKVMANAIRKLDREHGILKKGFLWVGNSTKMAALMPYLPEVRFWNPCTGGYATYYLSTKTLSECSELSPYQVVESARRRFGDISKVLFLFTKPMPVAEDKNYYFQKIFAAGAGVFGYTYETFYLYRPLPKRALSGTGNTQTHSQ